MNRKDEIRELLEKNQGKLEEAMDRTWINMETFDNYVLNASLLKEDFPILPYSMFQETHDLAEAAHKAMFDFYQHLGQLLWLVEFAEENTEIDISLVDGITSKKLLEEDKEEICLNFKDGRSLKLSTTSIERLEKRMEGSFPLTLHYAVVSLLEDSEYFEDIGDFIVDK